jgi:hypothetical protein
MPPVSGTVNPLVEPGWDDMVGAHPAGSFFHTTPWARVLVESYGYRPVYFTVVENGTLQALLPVMEIRSVFTGRRGVSLPFSDYADPFAADEEQYRFLANRAVQYGKEKGWGTLEIRGGECPWPERISSREFLGHRLNLGRSENEIHTGFRTNLKRNLARALKEGVKVEMLHSAAAMEEYYRLHCITRKGHGIPPQPRKFFRKIQEHVIGPGKGVVILATHKDQVVAGAVYFHHGKKAMYKYGASSDAGKQVRANNLVMWEAVRWHRENGFSELCFGRTEPSDEGLRDYKRSYGNGELALPYYKFDISRNRVVAKPAINGAGHFERYFRKVPIPVSRIVGTLVYRHIG